MSPPYYTNHSFSIRDYLETRYQISSLSKGKITCPFCQHQTLAIKGDSLAKCFHPSCGRFINQHSATSHQEHFQQLLWNLMAICNGSLLKQADNPAFFEHSAYRYLCQDRKLHPQVIADSPVIGSIPACLDFEKHCQKYRHRLQLEADPKKQKELLDSFNQEAEKLGNLLAKHPGWLVFGYTNASQKLLSLKFREAYSKRFALFKSSEQAGVFNPIPFDTNENRLFPNILLAEGEFNILSLQSLLLRNNLSYGLAMAVGSASSVDWVALKGFKEKWLLFQDNDEAGRNLAQHMQAHRTYQLAFSNFPDDDLDGFIQRHSNPEAALLGLQKLLGEAKPKYRLISAIKDSINAIRRKEKKNILAFEINQQVGQLLKGELLERGQFFRTVLCSYYLDQNTQTLYPIYKGGRMTQRFLHSFSLNPTENIHNFVRDELEKAAHDHGTETTIRHFAHYDKATNRLYLYNHDTEIFRISVSSIEVVVNGTDGHLFESLPGYKAFTRQEVTLETDLLSELYTSRVNVESGALELNEYQLLLETWVYHLFFDELHITHPILAFIGPKGSSKTSSIRRLGVLLFGPGFQVCPIPEKPDDFDAVVTNGFLVGFDNVDGQTVWLNDKLAIAATGGTIRKRELYSTNNMIEFPIKAHIAITSRTPKFRRDDVAERLLIFPLKTLDQKISEQYLLDELCQNRDRFMSWLLLQLQEILQMLSQTENFPAVQTNLRMADFASFMLRLAMADGEEASVQKLLDKLVTSQSHFTLEQDPLFELLDMVAERYPKQAFKTAELHAKLKDLAAANAIKYSYASPNSLGQKLGHVKNNLAQFLNMTIHEGAGNTKFYEFSRLNTESS